MLSSGGSIIHVEGDKKDIDFAGFWKRGKNIIRLEGGKKERGERRKCEFKREKQSLGNSYQNEKGKICCFVLRRSMVVSGVY